jgi:hypothetical protein
MQSYQYGQSDQGAGDLALTIPEYLKIFYLNNFLRRGQRINILKPAVAIILIHPDDEGI